MRILRLVRLTRLMVMIRTSLEHKPVSKALAVHVEKIAALTHFAKAHLNAQQEFLSYFGSAEHKPQSKEAARCLVESQTQVCNALFVVSIEIGCLDIRMLIGSEVMRQSSRAAQELVKFVQRATHFGAMQQKEACVILEPLEDHERKVQLFMRAETMGVFNANDERLLLVHEIKHDKPEEVS